MSKLRIAVIFGGRSGEHEVSLMSATSIISALDPARYGITPIFISKQGKWLDAQDVLGEMQAGKVPDFKQISSANWPSREIIPDPSVDQGFDVVFPVLHGTYGEDGTIQGLLELANIPYVGAGVAGSAVSMDKGMMRVLFASQDLPLLPWVTVSRSALEKNAPDVIKQIEEEIGYPCFVKPANLGSSVGISKAKDQEALTKALAFAAEFDRRIVVEQGLNKPREIECSVLGNDEPRVAVPGEIVPGNEFYDYEAKYIQDNSELIIPARLNPEQIKEVQDLAMRAYKAVDCAGLARVDFFLSETGKFILNEINTIPGFTRISMYPKLWGASGIGFADLIEKLISLALERHKDQGRSRRSL